MNHVDKASELYDLFYGFNKNILPEEKAYIKSKNQAIEEAWILLRESDPSLTEYYNQVIKTLKTF